MCAQHLRTRTACWFIAILLAISACLQMDETFAAVRFWWLVHHASIGAFVVPYWWTSYTVVSSFFAPIWLVLIGLALLLSHSRPVWGIISLSCFLVLLPLSCASAPAQRGGSGYLLSLEELPFASAEREANLLHMGRLAERLKKWGLSHGRYPNTESELMDASRYLASEPSPYEQNSMRIPYQLVLIQNNGVPYNTKPSQPGIVYYAVNPSGRQFALTVSALNAPVSEGVFMAKETSFIGEKQPWGGLLALVEIM